MEQIHLFSNPLHRCKIDPESYNKQALIDIVTKNYQIDKTRNSWDKISNIHHYYNDWNNPNYEKLNTEDIVKIYGELIQKYIDDINFSQNINYFYKIVNVTASDGTQYMAEHDHFEHDEGYILWSCVHYISLSDEHSVITFKNPLLYAQYNNNLSSFNKLFDRKDVNNSCYFPEFKLQTSEDDFIIFPSYIKHRVDPSIKTDKLRICVVTNVFIKPN